MSALMSAQFVREKGAFVEGHLLMVATNGDVVSLSRHRPCEASAGAGRSHE